jgi:hypothetical protein
VLFVSVFFGFPFFFAGRDFKRRREGSCPPKKFTVGFLGGKRRKERKKSTERKGGRGPGRDEEGDEVGDEEGRAGTIREKGYEYEERKEGKGCICAQTTPMRGERKETEKPPAQLSQHREQKPPFSQKK